MPTPEQVAALAEAMDQLLDDMGTDGQSVCRAAKAQARIAFEPFRDPDDDGRFMMSVAEAERIVAEIEGARS